MVARDASKDSSSDPAMADDTVPNVNVAASCSVDEPETCSLADLEILYVDALWNYYNDGKFTLSDAQYDRIREELNWQGSGFPTLRRDEIQFVQAAIAYSRGEKIMGDEEYEELKRKIKTEAGKRRDVTALLLYTKGQQLLDEAQFELMSEEMMKLGIDVGMKGDVYAVQNADDARKRHVGGGENVRCVGVDSIFNRFSADNLLRHSRSTRRQRVGLGVCDHVSRHLDVQISRVHGIEQRANFNRPVPVLRRTVQAIV